MGLFYSEEEEMELIAGLSVLPSKSLFHYCL